MKKLVAVSVLAVAASLTTAAPAQAADGPKCVSKAEYSKVKNGMTPAQVTSIFHGLRGTTTARTDMFLEREYRVCTSQFGTAYVSWSRGIASKDYRVGFKAATW